MTDSLQRTIAALRHMPSVLSFAGVTHDEQLTLALTRRADPPTSRAAAALVSTTDLEALVLGVLRAHPAGLTSHEVAAALNRELVSISPRMRPLCDEGRVREAGRRDGRTVWAAEAA